jgi:hypothetical protein
MGQRGVWIRGAGARRIEEQFDRLLELGAEEVWRFVAVLPPLRVRGLQLIDGTRNEAEAQSAHRRVRRRSITSAPSTTRP